MAILAHILSLVVFIPIALVSLFWCVQIILGVGLIASLRLRANAAKQQAAGVQDSTDIRLTVLIPAHNEETGIQATLASVFRELGAEDNVLVVADNCTDRTAAVARDFGARVVERFDEVDRGKGFALARGVQYLKELGPPDGVIILDADCLVAVGAFDSMRRKLAVTEKPIQSVYLNVRPPGYEDRLNLRIAEFANRLKNEVRPLGLQLLGAPVHLTGSGMAFRWEDICDLDLATGHLAEDMDLGLTLAMSGKGAILDPEARVIGYFPVGDKAMGTQRRRWIHGHIAAMIESGPRVVLDGVRKGQLGTILIGLDTMIPPFFFLIAANISVAVLFAGLAAIGFVDVAIGLIAVALLMTVFLVLGFSVLSVGRGVIGVREILRVFPFGWRMVQEVVAGLFRREKTWVRTDRDNKDGSDS